MNRYLLVVNVRGEFDFRFPAPSARLLCELEDGRIFELDRVPHDIVLFVKKLRGEDINDERERIGDILMSMPDVLDMISRYLKRVLIDELDVKRGTYTAIAEFNDGSLTIRRKMVPSHAILLAMLVKKPIYVREELVEAQEQI